MKKQKRKLNTKKLLLTIWGVIIILYLTICFISYAHKTTKNILEYEPKEKTILIK